MKKGPLWEKEDLEQGNVPGIYRCTSRGQELLGGNMEIFASSYWKREDSWFPWILSRIRDIPNLSTTSSRLELKSDCGESFSTED